jgi:hypothetical protein
MSEMTVNWGELMAGGAAEFQPVPKGNYDVAVDTAEPKQSTTGKLMFAVKYKIESGPQAGRTVFNNITLTTDNPNALRYFFLNMKAMGLSQEFFATNPSPSAIAQALIGQRCRIEVDHRPYQGSMRENVKSISAAGGIMPGGAITGPSAPVSSPMIPTPGATVGPSPAMPQPTVAPVSAPVPTVAPVVAPQPSVAPAPQPAAPVETVSTATIPEPVNPAPAAEEAPAAAPAPTETPLPPGFTDREQYNAFLAFQAQQAAAAQPVAAPVQAPAAPPAATTGAPVPPPLPF